MLARTSSVALVGTDARIVEVEVHVGDGMPRFTMVGLAAKSVCESEQRVRSALAAGGQPWPQKRIVANLAPGTLRKDGTHLDLAIAVGLLAATERVPQSSPERWVVLGELTLNGHVRPVPGVLAAALAARAAGRSGVICPEVNGPEAALVDAIEVVPVSSLLQCIDFLRGSWTPPPINVAKPGSPQNDVDLAEVRGHGSAKRAAEIAVAGGHNLLLVESLDSALVQ